MRLTLHPPENATFEEASLSLAVLGKLPILCLQAVQTAGGQVSFTFRVSLHKRTKIEAISFSPNVDSSLKIRHGLEDGWVLKIHEIFVERQLLNPIYSQNEIFLVNSYSIIVLQFIVDISSKRFLILPLSWQL